MEFNQISVTTSETALVAANDNRKSMTIKVSGADIFIGATGLSATDGFQILNGQTFIFEDPVWTGALYALTSSGTATVMITEGE